MSTDPHPGPGLGDLEKELICSICTDLLYQPLTLLDCLHTFCGSCLKEWFSAQASRARSSSSVRFTCPSCRAVVRETRPNATVTTLLDMVLAASPDRDKSAEEKEEIARRYKHGDSVFPTLPSAERGSDASDDEDRRLLEEVRELSLQESRVRTRDTTASTGHRSRQSSRTRRTDSSADVDGARQRRREEERAARRRQGETVSERNRHIEHQSSLRSLLSLSDTETIQDQILRQILEEGLLDDIDLDNLAPAQEEELSERIADAYRRRHRLRSRSQQRLEARETHQPSSRARARSQSTQRPQESSTPTESARSPPPTTVTGSVTSATKVTGVFATAATPSPSLETYKILSIATNCDICTHPIPDSTPRFHCLQCNNGDYDICTNCYLRLVAIGKIRKENGHNGWRRCLKGHRMAVIGFEDHEEGQRRVILRDLVGGRALNDDHLIQPSSPAASPITAISSSNSTIASPEIGSGDWSWKEGSERRKKASRIRPWTIGVRDRDPISSQISSPPTTPNTTMMTPTNTRRYPPDGGVGLVVHALWSWYPEDGVKDELMFPRGAEITEAENINDDWYWGCYAGLTGLFPGAHVFVAGEVV
nr:hypothetical protein ANI_1_728024 [Aspergillus niger CBS 513.88]|eukprot:XP_001399658.2 hypothetical protein ANI_1_728024 [Aspergillus niger CBS 513.88]